MIDLKTVRGAVAERWVREEIHGAVVAERDELERLLAEAEAEIARLRAAADARPTAADRRTRLGIPRDRYVARLAREARRIGKATHQSPVRVLAGIVANGVYYDVRSGPLLRPTPD